MKNLATTTPLQWSRFAGCSYSDIIPVIEFTADTEEKKHCGL